MREPPNEHARVVCLSFMQAEQHSNEHLSNWHTANNGGVSRDVGSFTCRSKKCYIV